MRSYKEKFCDLIPSAHTFRIPYLDNSRQTG